MNTPASIRLWSIASPLACWMLIAAVMLRLGGILPVILPGVAHVSDMKIDIRHLGDKIDNVDQKLSARIDSVKDSVTALAINMEKVVRERGEVVRSAALRPRLRSGLVAVDVGRAARGHGSGV